MAKDILLDASGDLLFENGDLVVGDSESQEVLNILRINQGALKSDPLIGASLVRLVKANAPNVEIRKRAKLHLARDGKDYDQIKALINLDL